MDSITGYKDRAIATLSGNWGSAAVATLIFYAILFALSAVLDGVQANLGNIASLLLLPMSWAFVILFLDLVRETPIAYGRLFDGFKDYSRIFLTKLLQTIYLVLWSLLLIVPGVIKYYSYAMTDYILRDTDLSYNEAIDKSMEMMQGHKMDLFLLQLSFIGWFFLCLLTVGLGFLLLIPYMSTAMAHFYEDLKAEQGEL